MKGIDALELDRLLDDARALWRHASSSVGSQQLELFAKRSARRKATRGASGAATSIHDVLESGLACRCFEPRCETAGFAAAGGLSKETALWIAGRARSFESTTTAARPDPSAFEPERADLDAEDETPTADWLASLMGGEPSIEWIEIGTTVEVLVGVEGWVACRRRNRNWLESHGQLWANRGFDARGRSITEHPQATKEGAPDLLIEPSAAGALVEALARALGSTGQPCSDALVVDDVPDHALGLAGGSFDDAGFPTSRQKVAANGNWVSRPLGPGNLWRRSFREPPTASTANLVLSTRERAAAPVGAVVRTLNVIPLEANVWVLDLGSAATRIDPGDVARSIVGTRGTPTATAAGPIVPGLVLDSRLLARKDLG